MLHREIVLSSQRKEEFDSCIRNLQTLNTKVDYCQGKHYIKIFVNVDDTLLAKVKEMVARQIIVKRKHEYIRSKLKIAEMTPSLCMMISALVYFEQEQEINRVLQKMSQCETYNIEGFVNFRMEDLKEEWEELIDLTNSMLSCGYADTDLYNVASYMIAPRIVPSKSVFIADIGGQLVTNVSRGGIIQVEELYDNAEYNLINAVIAECPQELIVEGEALSSEVVKTLKNVFRVKVI